MDKGGTMVVMDLGLDWWEDKAAVLDLGPVLSLKDSVASKLLAVYSRGYARDSLDAYSIISSGRFTARHPMAVGRPRFRPTRRHCSKHSLRLAGNPVECPWDPKLAVAMAECGLALEEEAVANLLAGDVLAAGLS